LWLIYGEKIHAFPTFPPRNLTRFKIYTSIATKTLHYTPSR
jgi:hypothetical protein